MYIQFFFKYYLVNEMVKYICVRDFNYKILEIDKN